MTTLLLDELLSSPCPIATTHRVHAADVYPPMVVIIDGTPREVVSRARAIDGVIEFRTADGGVVALHPYRRVTVQ